MGTTDLPDRPGALADSAAARPPSELLARLRERLEQLDDNHPSAWRREDRRERGLPDQPDLPADDAGRPDLPAADEPRQDEHARDEPTQGDLNQGEPSEDGPSEDEHGHADGQRVPRERHAPRGQTDAGSGDLFDWLKDYRPWFTGDGSGTPWFGDILNDPGLGGTDGDLLH